MDAERRQQDADRQATMKARFFSSIILVLCSRKSIIEPILVFWTMWAFKQVIKVVKALWKGRGGTAGLRKSIAKDAMTSAKGAMVPLLAFLFMPPWLFIRSVRFLVVFYVLFPGTRLECIHYWSLQDCHKRCTRSFFTTSVTNLLLLAIPWFISSFR